MLIKILSVGAVISLILLALKKFVPIEKWVKAAEEAGDFLSATGGIKIGTKLWEELEDFFVNVIDRLWTGFKKGLRRNNPKLLKRIKTMELLREKVKKENPKDANKD